MKNYSYLNNFQIFINGSPLRGGTWYYDIPRTPAGNNPAESPGTLALEPVWKDQGPRSWDTELRALNWARIHVSEPYEVGPVLAPFLWLDPLAPTEGLREKFRNRGIEIVVVLGVYPSDHDLVEKVDHLSAKYNAVGVVSHNPTTILSLRTLRHLDSAVVSPDGEVLVFPHPSPSNRKEIFPSSDDRLEETRLEDLEGLGRGPRTPH